jgi:D-alanyl-D-alanine carboxypeptidase (penicillin-binding protein 5/6)
VPPPGVPSPPPLPVPEEPVGGDRLGECGLILPDGAPPPPEGITAASWLIADLETGAVLAAQDPHARHRPASTIKVLTALVAIREMELDDTIVATQEDADQEGSRGGLVPGTTYTVEQVVTGLLMQSGNDAAHALARKAGGMDAMVDKMNELARQLGALDTRAATPSGLDGPGMSASAYDLALIFREALREPAFAKAISTKQTLLPGAPEQPPLEIWSDNSLLLNYPGAIGGKTGFTDDARHTFIGAAERDGRKLVTVLMRGEVENERLPAQAMRLLDYGFELPEDAEVGELVTGKPKPESPSPTPAPRAAEQEVQEASGTDSGDTERSLFGNAGGPLALLAGAATALVGMVAVRNRRMRAMSRSDDGGSADDD